MVFTNNEVLWVWLLPLIIWSVIWKGFALWKSARGNQLSWFIILFVINTFGILEIIYLAFFQIRPKHVKQKKRK